MNWADAMQSLTGADFRILTVSVVESTSWSAQISDGGSTAALTSTVRYDALLEAQSWAEANGYKVMGQWVGDPDVSELSYRKLVVR